MKTPVTKEGLREEFEAEFKHRSWLSTEKAYREEIKTFLSQAYDRIYNQAIEDAEGCVPEIRNGEYEIAMPHGVDRLEALAKVSGYNSCLRDTLQDLSALKK
jgi:hypothetical protein